MNNNDTGQYVSIIVPVYNVEKYVERCIKSIIHQSYVNWELILVDDGSVDDSGIICDRFAKEYEKIYYYPKKHSGVSSARNLGMKYAKGDYILFADADDYLADKMLETMLREGERADLIVCGVYHLKKVDGKEAVVPTKILKITEKRVVENNYFEVLCRSSTLWNKLIKRDLIDNLLFDECKTYGEDMVFVTSLLPRAKKVIMIPDHLYYYNRFREGNIVTEELSSKTLEFLDNSVEVYSMTAKHHESSCGLFRISFAINRVLSMVDYSEKKKYKVYIRRCGRALRKTSLRDRINFTKDVRFKKKRKKLRLLYLIFPYFPYLVYSYAKTDMLWGVTH